MAQQTSNFGFTKPDPNDFYDVEVQNENWDKVDKQAVSCFSNFYSTDDAKNADDLTESLAIVPINSTVNAELFNALGGGVYAWVRTNFYDSVGTSSDKKTQIAMSTDFIHQKMVFRTYGLNGWLPWQVVATHTYGTEDLTPGESELSTGTLHFVYE